MTQRLHNDMTKSLGLGGKAIVFGLGNIHETTSFFWKSTWM